MRQWYLQCPQDHTIFAGYTKDGAVSWTLDKAGAKPFPSYHQATLGQIGLDRHYDGVGYYTTEIVSEQDL